MKCTCGYEYCSSSSINVCKYNHIVNSDSLKSGTTRIVVLNTSNNTTRKASKTSTNIRTHGWSLD